MPMRPIPEKMNRNTSKSRRWGKADPETRDIEKYTIGKLILWDTPGLVVGAVIGGAIGSIKSILSDIF